MVESDGDGAEPWNPPAESSAIRICDTRGGQRSNEGDHEHVT